MSRIPQIEAGIRALCTDPLPTMPRSRWIEDRHFKLYARAGRRVVFTPGEEAAWANTLTLATFDVIGPANYRTGLMREVFDFAEGFVRDRPDIGCTFVECTNNEIVVHFLRARGYRIVNGTDVLGTGLGANWFKMINPDAVMPVARG